MLTLWSGAEIEQVPHTLAYSASTIFDIEFIPGDVTSGINEYQVAIANNLATQREAHDPFATEGRMLWTEFTKLALQRARTARDAVLLMGELARTYKLGGDPGTLFGITDPSEGWWIEIATEGQWVAERVPDDAVSVRANAWRIGQVDLADPERFLGSPDLVEYAEARGWYPPAEAPFDFAAVYGDPAEGRDPSNTHREERALELLRLTAPRVTPQDIQAVLRDHYEGTAWDLTAGHTLGSPHQTDERTICVDSTELSAVCQSRSGMPAEIGAVCWRALTTPCTSPFVPWYLGATTIPAAYGVGRETPSPDSAYWAFRNLAEAVEADYPAASGPVHEAWSAFEAETEERQLEVEEEALDRWSSEPDRARALLSGFTEDRAVEAVRTAEVLLARLDGGSGEADAGQPRTDSGSADSGLTGSGDAGGASSNGSADTQDCTCRAGSGSAPLPACFTLLGLVLLRRLRRS